MCPLEGFHSEFSQQELTFHSEPQTRRFLAHFQLFKGLGLVPCWLCLVWDGPGDPKHEENLEPDAGKAWQELTFDITNLCTFIPKIPL